MQITCLFRPCFKKLSVKLLALGLCFGISACASKLDKSVLITDESMRVQFNNDSANPAAKESQSNDGKRYRPGVTYFEGRLLIKAKGKSFVSILDEVARTRRFNYTVLGDVSKFYVDYFNIQDDQILQLKYQPGIVNDKFWTEKVSAQEFTSVDEFVEASVSEIKAAYSNSNDAELRKLATNLRYRWSGDGFVFYQADNIQIVKSLPASKTDAATSTTSAITPATAIFDEGYKKIFLYNLSEREVSFYLSRLYDIPYSSYSPSRSAELPRRETVAAQGVSQQGATAIKTEEVKPVDATAWVLNDSSGNKVTGGANRFGTMRWITIPQQNAILIRGTADQLDVVGQMLHSIDSDYRQVVLEAKVFEYDTSLSKRLGLALGSISGALDIKQTIGNSAISVSKVFGSDVSNALPLNYYALSSAERRFALLSALVLHARDGLVRVVAEPRLLLKPGQISTMDITNSKIVQPNSLGATLPGATNSAIQPIKVEAGVFFTVRPTLLSDQKIQLDLFLKQSEFTASNERNVLISTNENQMATSIIASNGEWISLGGLDSKKYAYSNSGIPGLKDVAGIGGAFGATEEESSTVRVEFMLRPVIRDMEDDQKLRIAGIKDLNKRIEDFMANRAAKSSVAK